jgi:hypothetical protein
MIVRNYCSLDPAGRIIRTRILKGKGGGSLRPECRPPPSQRTAEQEEVRKVKEEWMTKSQECGVDISTRTYNTVQCF